MKLAFNSSTRPVVFYILLIVHPGMILVSNQLDAQFFFLVCL